MLIYPEDKEFLRDSTMCYENIETGGDLFGLWKNENEVVVQLVTGPGKYCRRTTTAFFQDATYLSSVGKFLTSAKGLCNIGEWHSHHRLNLPEPSGGDKATVWRNMPSCGLKRFLLIIATITPEGQVNMNGFMFTAPENGSISGGMQRVETRVLAGPNPFRILPDVQAKLQEGVEPRRGLQQTPGSAEYGPPSSSSSEPVATFLREESKSRKQQGFGQLPARIFAKHRTTSPYKKLSDTGESSGHFSTRNGDTAYSRDHTTPQHVPTQREQGHSRHQQAPTSPAHYTTAQTSSYKVSYQMSSNV